MQQHSPIKIMPSSEVRDRMSSVIKELQANGAPCYVTQYGKAAAVLLSVDQYNELLERLSQLEATDSSGAR